MELAVTLELSLRSHDMQSLNHFCETFNPLAEAELARLWKIGHRWLDLHSSTNAAAPRWDSISPARTEPSVCGSSSKLPSSAPLKFSHNGGSTFCPIRSCSTLYTRSKAEYLLWAVSHNTHRQAIIQDIHLKKHNKQLNSGFSQVNNQKTWERTIEKRSRLLKKREIGKENNKIKKELI